MSGDERRNQLKEMLERLAEAEHEEFLRRSSRRFLECAINLCVTHMSLHEVAELLDEEARQLRRYH